MHIIELVSANTWCGLGRYALEVACGMAAEGHRVEVITSTPSAMVGDHFVGAGLTPVATLPLRGAVDVVSAVRLASRLRRCGQEVVVHAHTLDAAIVAIRARELSGNGHVGLVLTLAGVDAARSATTYCTLLDRLAAVIVPSERVRGELVAAAGGDAAGERVHVVCPAVAPPHPAEAPADSDGAGAAVLWRGAIAPERGLDTLLDAMGLLLGDLPWRLCIMGEGKAQHVGPLKQQAQRLGIAGRTHWLGYSAAFQPAAGEAYIGVVPTPARATLGMAALDFLSHGIALVGSSALPQAEVLVDGRDALLTAPGDAPALAAALRSLLADPSRRRALAAAGLAACAGPLSYRTFVQRTAAILQSARI